MVAFFFNHSKPLGFVLVFIFTWVAVHQPPLLIQESLILIVYL